MYELLILLTSPDIKGTEPYARAIEQEYATHKGGVRPLVKLVGDSIEIVFGQFKFYVDVSCAPHVLEESAEIALQFAKGHPEQRRIAQAACRYELHSDEDRDMEYFNDMVFLSEAASSLAGAFVFDPQAGEFQ